MKNREAFEIYVHIPFCKRKCDYCDFVSFACEEKNIEGYFNALKNQIEQEKETVGNNPVVSCFFGGGTPSLPDASYISETLCKLKECFSFEEDAEITIEVNPNSATYEKLCEYKNAGINRISIGLQSSNDEELKSLSRLHSYDEFLKTYNDARRARFDNVNIDIMSAIPGQTLESYRETLEKVALLSPEHISAYSLILEEGTPFFERYKDGSGLPDEDIEREMYYMTKSLLAEYGYRRYEISNYSKPGYECRHNLGYWERRRYIGFGIASSSFVCNKRFTCHSDLKSYIKGDYTKETELLSKEDCMSEFMFLGLRCCAGVSASEFFENFGVSLEEHYKVQLRKLEKEGLIVLGERIYLTDKGMDVANYCMCEFLPD